MEDNQSTENEFNADNFDIKVFNVNKTLISEAALNYAKSEVCLGLLVQILAKLENRDSQEIWTNVNVKLKEYQRDFRRIHLEDPK